MRQTLLSGRALPGPARRGSLQAIALHIAGFGEGCGTPGGEKNGRKMDERGLKGRKWMGRGLCSSKFFLGNNPATISFILIFAYLTASSKPSRLFYCFIRYGYM